MGTNIKLRERRWKRDGCTSWRMMISTRQHVRLCIDNSPEQRRNRRGDGYLVIPTPGPDDGFIMDGTIYGRALETHRQDFQRLNCDYSSAMYIRDPKNRQQWLRVLAVGEHWILDVDETLPRGYVAIEVTASLPDSDDDD